MITLSPIAENIQDTLYKKIAMMKAGAGVSVVKLTQGDDAGKWVRTDDIRAAKEHSHRTAEHESIFARSPFMRMTSFVPKQFTVNQPVVLLGGELNNYGSLDQNFSARYKATLTVVPKDSPWYEEAVGRFQTGAYNTEEVDPLINTTVESQPYRPYPGIKDVSIEYRGGGMKLGATRTANINWTCWTWEELDRLTPHFLSPGKSILLEWGWAHAKGRNPELMKIFTRNKDTSVLEYDPDEINDLIEKVPEHVQKQNGDYDAILGVIQDFTWSVNATGGFDCTTTVISRGITLLQNRSKGSNQTFKKFETLPLLNLTKDGDKDLGNWTERVRFNAMRGVAPYISFREYMSDFPSQIFHKLAMFDSQSPARGGPTDDDYWSKQYKYFPAIRIDAVKIFRPLISEHRSKSKYGQKASKALDKNAAACWSMHHLNKVGAYHFITWGWFEDNVLSRFFGQVELGTNNSEIISEFRSIQRLVDDKGKFVKFPEGHMKDGNPIYQSNRFRNSPYLVTLDTSKWIIPNQGDPIWTMNINWEKGTKYQDDPTSADKNNIQMRGAKRTTEMKPAEHKEFVQHFAPYNLDPELKLEDITAEKGGPKQFWNPPKDIVRDYGDGTDIEHMDIRKILFNVKYLSDMMKDSTTLSQAVLDLWENFSNEYGGIYKFKIDLDESSQRMGLIEEGWTGVKVERYMENEKNKKNGDAAAYPNLFVFPTMEDGSIVKSQTINAQLPTRMKQSAMYAIKAPKSDGIEEVSNMSYDEFVGNIWGTHHNALGIDSELSADKAKDKRLEDKLIGDIGWPGKDNAPFGLMSADESSKLKFGANIGSTTITPLQNIMMIEHSILEDIDESEKKYLQQQYKTYSTIGGTGNETSKEKPIDMKEMDAWKNGFNIAFAKNFNATFYTGDKPKEQGAIGQFYGLKDLIINPDVKIHGDLFPGQDAEMKAMMEEFEMDLSIDQDDFHVPTTVKNKVAERYYFSQQKWYPKIFKWDQKYFNLSRDASGGIAIEGMDGKLAAADANIWASHGYIMFRPEVKNELIKLLRGNENGVLQNTNVLIPIDFEMEIDGTGGLFPGNSFHSSYLSTRYKEETIFQMVGVNHIIDSSGWFTTIKGQIRSNALHKLDSQPEGTQGQDDETVIEGDNETVVETEESCKKQGKILDPAGSGTCVENPVVISSNVGKSVAKDKSTNGNEEKKEPKINEAFCTAQGQIFDTATGQCKNPPGPSEELQNAKDGDFMAYVDDYVRHRLARNLVFSEPDLKYFVEHTSMYKETKGGSDMGKLFNYYTQRFDIYHGGTGKYKENETAKTLADPATVLWAMPAINAGKKIYPDWNQGEHSW